jgi:hypothetical protein
MGLYPNPFIEKMTPSIEKLIQQSKVRQMAYQQAPVTMQGAPMVIAPVETK